MASIRLALIEHLLGRPAAARKAQRIYVETPRSGVVLLEAWNDVFAALSGRDDAREPLDRARRTFGELGLEPGLRFVRVALVASLVRSGDLARLRALLLELERVGPSSHRVLRVLEPLARAEIAWRLGEAGRVSLALSEATAEIVGLPLLEADLRIDFLRALVAQREGDRATARHHLHRSLQTRELIARGLPADGRRTYLTQERFRALDELGEKLERLGSLRSTAPVPDLPQVVRKVIARSSAMRRLVAMLFRMRDAELPVLITGETGAGKELIARCIHALGPRSDALFEAIHCSAIPAELFESELFGHGAGAFTGAEVERPGLLEHIERGTALLDDIENLAPDLQRKLAQVIESRRIRPLGSVEPRTIDVRFLASSSMSGDEAMRAGKLIPELYFRLRAIELRVPPLRERLADLPELVEMFVAEAARRLERPLPRVDGEAMEELSLHDWPGNVRELEAISSRLVLESSPGETITAAHVRGVISPRESPTLFSSGRIEDRSLADLKRELERAYLERLFRSTGGNIAAMLERLEIKRSNLYTWFAKLGLDIRAMREDLRERERE
ncbi:MAG TPA: sigma 54-interacting transcriptional regulator [Planctomycetota bacterium]|nr:sigma 54-interacting transcriptional regulator [Planctomycetota bacterium]